MGLKFNVFTGNLDYTGNTYFVENGDTLELWWNGSLVQSWTVTPPATSGTPIGLLLVLTRE